MFHVDWLRCALDELALTWLNADGELRRKINVAAQRIDAELRTKADERGESRSEGRRVLFIEPLGATFHVDIGLKVVTVLHVWQFGHRRS